MYLPKKRFPYNWRKVSPSSNQIAYRNTENILNTVYNSAAIIIE